MRQRLDSARGGRNAIGDVVPPDVAPCGMNECMVSGQSNDHDAVKEWETSSGGCKGSSSTILERGNE